MASVFLDPNEYSDALLFPGYLAADAVSGVGHKRAAASTAAAYPDVLPAGTTRSTSEDYQRAAALEHVVLAESTSFSRHLVLDADNHSLRQTSVEELNSNAIIAPGQSSNDEKLLSKKAIREHEIDSRYGINARRKADQVEEGVIHTMAALRQNQEKVAAVRALRALKKTQPASNTHKIHPVQDKPKFLANQQEYSDAFRKVYSDKLAEQKASALDHQRRQMALRQLNESIEDIRQDIVVASSINSRFLKQRDTKLNTVESKARKWQESLLLQKKSKKSQCIKRELIRQRLMEEEHRIRQKLADSGTSLNTQQRMTRKINEKFDTSLLNTDLNKIIETVDNNNVLLVPRAAYVLTEDTAPTERLTPLTPVIQLPVTSKWPNPWLLPLASGASTSTLSTYLQTQTKKLNNTTPSLSTLTAFTTTPQTLTFNDVIPGSHYHQELVLTNTSGRINSIRFIEVLNDPDMWLDVSLLASGPLSPGLICKAQIHLSIPVDCIFNKTDMKLVFDCAHNGRILVDVNVLLKFSQPFLKRSKYCKRVQGDDEIYQVDLSDCIPGDIISRPLRLIHSILEACSYTICFENSTNIENNAWSISNCEREGVLRNQIPLDFNVIFSATPDTSTTATIQQRLVIRFGVRHLPIKPIVCILNVKLREVPLYVDKDTLDFGICVVGECYRDYIILHSRSATPVKYTIAIHWPEQQKMLPHSSNINLISNSNESSNDNLTVRNLGEVEHTPNKGIIKPGEHAQIWFKIKPSRDAWIESQQMISNYSGSAPTFHLHALVKISGSPRIPISINLLGSFTDVSLRLTSDELNFGRLAVGDYGVVPLEIANESYLSQSLLFSSHMTNNLCTQASNSLGTLTVQPLCGGLLQLLPKQTANQQVRFTPAQVGKYEVIVTCQSSFGRTLRIPCNATVYQPFARFSHNHVKMGQVSFGSQVSAKVSLNWVYTEKEMMRRQKSHVPVSEFEEGTFEFGQPEIWYTNAFETSNGASYSRIEWKTKENGDIPLKIYPLGGTLAWAKQRLVDIHFNLAGVAPLLDSPTVIVPSVTSNSTIAENSKEKDVSVNTLAVQSAITTPVPIIDNLTAPIVTNRQQSAKVKTENRRISNTAPKMRSTREHSGSQSQVLTDVKLGNTTKREGGAFLFKIPCRLKMLHRCKYIQTKALQIEEYFPKESTIYLQVEASITAPTFVLTHENTTVSSLNFGQVPIFQRRVLYITLKNVSKNILAVKVRKVSPFSPFSIPTKLRPVEPDTTLDLALVYEPMTTENQIDYIDLATSSTQARIRLEGTSYVPAVTVNPTLLEFDFGDVLVGDASTCTFTISNTSNVPVSFSALAASNNAVATTSAIKACPFFTENRVKELLQQTKHGDVAENGDLPFTISPMNGSVASGEDCKVTITFRSMLESANYWVDGLLLIWGLPPQSLHFRGRCHRFTVFVSQYPFVRHPPAIVDTLASLSLTQLERKDISHGVTTDGEMTHKSKPEHDTVDTTAYKCILLNYNWLPVSQKIAATISEEVAMEHAWDYYQMEHDPISINNDRIEAKKNIVGGYQIKQITLALETEPTSTDTQIQSEESILDPIVIPPESQLPLSSSLSVVTPQIVSEEHQNPPTIHVISEAGTIEFGKQRWLEFEVLHLSRIIPKTSINHNSTDPTPTRTKKSGGHGNDTTMLESNQLSTPAHKPVYRITKGQKPLNLVEQFEIICTGGVDMCSKKPAAEDVPRICHVHMSLKPMLEKQQY